MPAAPWATRTPAPVSERSLPRRGDGGVLPVAEIPVDRGDLGAVPEESVGNAVAAYPERIRNRATVPAGCGEARAPTPPRWHAVPFGRDRRATGCVDRTLNRTGSPTVDMRGSPAP